jgi:isopenicillin N synthase-like dioxygenase
MKKQVPVLNYQELFNPEKKQEFINNFTNALKEYGFLILDNHPIPLDLIERVYKHSESFFLSDINYKQRFINPVIKQSGYIPFGIEKAKDSKHFDLKEFWQVVNDSVKDAPVKNVWTDDIQFNNALKKLYKDFSQLSEELLKVVGEGLNIDLNYQQELIQEQNSVLRIIHYPPLDKEMSGHVRAAAHEDINLLTIMPGASDSGLEILTKDGEWLPIDSKYKYLIVDSGDMLARITNGVIPATTHRVVNPQDPTKRRFSMPFFCHPNSNAILKCIDSCVGDGVKFSPIKSIDFLNDRLEQIGLKK